MNSELMELAKKARKNSYSPYSGHAVGAAVRMSDGKIYSGCNVENASYGGTICAERVAINKAVSEGSRKIIEIAVVTDPTPPTSPWPPCGICCQTLAEFGSAETLIHWGGLTGKPTTKKLSEILPHSFTPEHIQGKQKNS